MTQRVANDDHRGMPNKDDDNDDDVDGSKGTATRMMLMTMLGYIQRGQKATLCLAGPSWPLASENMKCRKQISKKA